MENDNGKLIKYYAKRYLEAKKDLKEIEEIYFDENNRKDEVALRDLRKRYYELETAVDVRARVLANEIVEMIKEDEDEENEGK